MPRVNDSIKNTKTTIFVVKRGLEAPNPHAGYARVDKQQKVIGSKDRTRLHGILKVQRFLEEKQRL